MTTTIGSRTSDIPATHPGAKIRGLLACVVLAVVAFAFVVLTNKPSDAAADRAPGQYVVNDTPIQLNQPGDPYINRLTPSASAADEGMFAAVEEWPIIAIHASVASNGELVTWGSPVDEAVQGGVAFVDTDVQTIDHEITATEAGYNGFCNLAAALPDGRLAMLGGNSPLSTQYYDPTTQAQGQGPQLDQERWYATGLRRPNNEIVVLGGANPYYQSFFGETGDNSGVAITPEIGDGIGPWRRLEGGTSGYFFSAGRNRWWYPRAYNAPNGQVFGVSNERMWYLDTNGSGAISGAGELPFDINSSGSSVMFDTGRILFAGGGQATNDEPGLRATDRAAVVDINGNAPQVTEVQSMQQERHWLNLTVMANGEVLSNGGTSLAATAEPVYAGEIWNPNTATWRPADSAARIRTYHSTAVLLPSGAVWTGGGGAPGPVNNLDAEWYLPPYLFEKVGGQSQWAERPEVRSIAGSLTWGGTVDLTMADSRTISSASLISLGSVTHSYNVDQRHIPVSVDQTGDVVAATLPASADIIPPGSYLLQVVDANGVPSPSQIVTFRLGQPGEVTIFDAVQSAPTEDVEFEGGIYRLGTPGLSWTAAKAEAEAAGGYLVSINSPAENQFVADTFMVGNPIWIGLTDEATEGVFTWGDGTSPSYTNWLQGEPNNGGGAQDFGAMVTPDGRWDDANNAGGFFNNGGWAGGYVNQSVIELRDTTGAVTLTVPLINASFENPVLGDSQLGAMSPGWTGGSGTFNPGLPWYDNLAGNARTGTMTGANSAYFFGANPAPLQQITDTTIEAGTTYALTAAIGDRSNGDAFAGVKMEILADGIPVAAIAVAGVPTQDSFGDATVTWTANIANNAATLGVRFSTLDASGGYVDIDNVRLTATTSGTALPTAIPTAPTATPIPTVPTATPAPPAPGPAPISADCVAKRETDGADVVLLIGQSNMSGYGQPYNAAIDGVQDSRIQQWSRTNTIVSASEKLQHADWGAGSQQVGMGTSFARSYLATLPAQRDILLVPAAFGGTSLQNGDGRWSPGNDLFEDAVARLTAAVNADSGNCVAAILWHQGESDVGNNTYAANLDNMITTLRSRVARADQAPFILGEFAPGWEPNNTAVRDTLSIINATPDRLPLTAVAPSAGLPSNPGDIIHFNADGMRAYGVRYFEALNAALANAPQPPPAPTATPVIPTSTPVPPIPTSTPVPPVPVFTALTSGVSTGLLTGATGSESVFAIEVPEDAAALSVVLEGSGDADLYVNAGSVPTLTDWDCRPYIDQTTNETCSLVNPAAGTWYVMVRGYGAYDQTTLTATVTDTSTPSTGNGSLTNGVAVTALAGATGSETLFTIDVPAGAGSLTVDLTGTGDADLYVNAGSAPTLTDWDCRPYLDTTSNETCTITNPTAGTWHVMVRGYASYINGSLTATWATTSTPTSPTMALTSGVTSAPTSGAIGDETLYTIDVPAGTSKLVVVMAGSGDADLYTHPGTAPTLDVWTCRPYVDLTSNETCTIDNPSTGTWFLTARGYTAFSNTTITATLS